MKLLIDECIDERLRLSFAEHDCRTARFAGLAGLKNGQPYGTEGVQAVVEVIQTEFARDMAMCGKVNLKAVDRTVVRIHKR